MVVFAVAECDSVTFSGSANTSGHDTHPAILRGENAPVGFAESRCEVISQIVSLMLLKRTRNSRISFRGCIGDAVASWCCVWHLGLQPSEGPEDARVSTLTYIDHSVCFV